MYRSNRLAIVATAASVALLAGCAGSDGGNDEDSDALADSSVAQDLLGDLWEVRDDVLAGGLPVEDEIEEFEDWTDLDDPDLDDDYDIEDDYDIDELEDDFDPDEADGDLMDAEQIEGVWNGNDGSIFGVVSAEESETVFPSTHYLPPDSLVETDECYGILLGSAAAGWNTSFNCQDDEPGEGDFVRIEEAGDGLDISWLDDEMAVVDTVSYTFLSSWEEH